jgi:DNA repair protein RadD
MIKNNYLTKPVKVDTPVTSYDFSELTELGRMYTSQEVEDILIQQQRLTPLIVKNIVDITQKYNRKACMIFSSNVKHAKEILSYLPEGQGQIVLGDTENEKRDEIINDFKAQKYKYLVNVSVLTTGFDAPHVDVIAIMRPTESVSLYQQIIGRGLRLSADKKECFILDYAGIGFNLYAPEVGEKKPNKDSTAVYVTCPKCEFENTFWGIVDDEGNVLEHYGRKCRGAVATDDGYDPCGYLFRYKLCPSCGFQNDITAKDCSECGTTLVDADSKLKQAKLSKDMHILRPDTFELNEKLDKNGKSFLEVRYYDFDSKYLSEIHYLNNQTARTKFDINFLRSHLRRPELACELDEPQEVIRYKPLLRVPKFIIARKQGKFWRITEKIFSEEVSGRYS